MDVMTAALVAVEEHLGELRGAPGQDGKRGRPGIEGKAGDPGLTWRGTFAYGTTYQPGDVVEWEGSSYVALVVTARRPPDPEWDLLAAKGEAGASGRGYIRGGGGSAGSALTVSDEGGALTAAAASIDFVGGGVTATAVGTAVTVTVPSGGVTDATYYVTAAHAGLSAEVVVPAFVQTILDDTTAGGVIATLGLDADIATFALPASTTISAFGASLVDDAAASNARTTLGLVINTDVPGQAAFDDHSARHDAGGADVLAIDAAQAIGSLRTITTSAAQAIGTAAAGAGTAAASSNHVHPTGAGTPTTQAFGDAAATGTGPAASMTDHKHAMPADPVTAHTAAADPHTGYILEGLFDAKGDLIAASADNTPIKLTVGANDTIIMADSAAASGLKYVASQTPTTQAFSDAAAQGTADTYARGDHLHGMPASPTATVTWISLARWGL